MSREINHYFPYSLNIAAKNNDNNQVVKGGSADGRECRGMMNHALLNESTRHCNLQHFI